MNPDTFFVQTDPAFNVALQSLRELRDQNRLHVMHYQTASLENIESDDESDDRRFVFGGDVAASADADFSRTASAVIRMCMLATLDVPRKFWPQVGRNCERRNKAKLVRMDEKPFFSFDHQNGRHVGKHYMMKYDQLYSPFMIEHILDKRRFHNTQVKMPRMMLIFSRQYNRVVRVTEITTSFTATPKGDRGGQEFDSFIHVACIVRAITIDSKTTDGESFKQLKTLMKPVTIQDKYFEEMTKAKELKDLESLPDALGELEL